MCNTWIIEHISARMNSDKPLIFFDHVELGIWIALRKLFIEKPLSLIRANSLLAFTIITSCRFL